MDTNIINYCNSTETIYGILNLFKESFLRNLKPLKSKDRKLVIKALPYLYRIWYYSALVPGTTLTPANFINTQIRKNFNDDSMVVPAVIPIYDKKVLKNFKFEYTIFNLDNHPVLKDMNIFLEHCMPDIGIDKDGLILEDESDSFINLLSFKEIYYVTFLTNTAYELELLKKMPSINTYRAMVIYENTDAFFKLSSVEQLRKIYDATLTIASRALCSTFTYDESTFSKESLQNLFKNAVFLDDFLDDIFKKFNMKSNTNFDELEFEFINSINDSNINNDELEIALALKLELNVIIDACLLTPIGYYLQLIQPIYVEETDFEILFAELIVANNFNIPFLEVSFIMSEEYDLTPLGEKLLLEGKPSKDEYQKLKATIGFKKLYKDIVTYNCLDNLEGDHKDDKPFFSDEMDELLAKIHEKM